MFFVIYVTFRNNKLILPELIDLRISNKIYCVFQQTTYLINYKLDQS